MTAATLKSHELSILRLHNAGVLSEPMTTESFERLVALANQEGYDAIRMGYRKYRFARFRKGTDG